MRNNFTRQYLGCSITVRVFSAGINIMTTLHHLKRNVIIQMHYLVYASCQRVVYLMAFALLQPRKYYTCTPLAQRIYEYSCCGCGRVRDRHFKMGIEFLFPPLILSILNGVPLSYRIYIQYIITFTRKTLHSTILIKV